MKKLFLLSLLTLLPMLASAYDAQVDGIYYNFSGTEATVTFLAPSIRSNRNAYMGDVTVPETVTYNDIIYSVTSIGERAFNGCSSLTSIIIPKSVNTIGSGAFSGCSKLTSVTINSCAIVSKSYSSSSNIGNIFGKQVEEYIIWEDVTSIGNYAFYGCSKLTSITIPGSVTSIGEDAFYNTAWFNNQPDGLVYVGNIAYKYKGTMPENTSISIKEGTKSIGSRAFLNCYGLISIEIPNSVNTIEWGAFSGCSKLTSVKINSNALLSSSYVISNFFGNQVTEYIIGETVTTIGDGVFYGCSGLTSIEIPNSVTTIGDGAFSYCTNLTSIEIPNSVTSIGRDAFYNTAWLNNKSDGLVYVGDIAYKYKGTMPENTSISIKEGTISIGGGAFQSCSGLISIEIPNGVKTIGDGAFYNCYNLTSITIPNSVTTIEKGAFQYCFGLTSIEIPNGVKTIGDGAFWGCYNLTSITIPNSVVTIEKGAFQACSGLTSVSVESGNTVYDSRDNCNAIIETANNCLIAGCQNTVIPNSVKSIGNGAFSGCSGLTSVTIPNSVTTIGSGAFYGCPGLTSILVESGNTEYDSRDNCNAIIETANNCLITGCQNTLIPNSVKSIGNGAFSGCSRLEEITIPNSVTTIGEDAFSGCRNLTSVTITNSVTSIGNYAFYGCTGMTSIEIPNSLTSIGDYVFCNCSGLTSITFPNSVTSIGNSAFERCYGLKKITIPNSVTSIGSRAFFNCSGLKNVYCYAEDVPTAESEAFQRSTYLATLHVLMASLDAYKSTNPWYNFDSIVAMDGPTIRGDASDNGKVTMDDAIYVANILLGKEEATEEADVNKDGEINMTDVMFIVNYIQNGRFPDDPTIIDLLENDDYNIFLEALKRTGLSNTVLSYKHDKEYYVDNPTDNWGYNILYYPKSRYDGWTVFAEKDDVFRANGINNFEDLAAKCAEWYASPSWYDYVKEKGINISTGTDYENEWNVVHMFVAYHILKAKLPVDKLVYERLAENENWNVCFGYEPQSYYETLLPGTLLKVWATDVDDSHLRPNLWVNRYVKNNTLTDQYGTFGSDAMHPIIYSGAHIDRASSLGTGNCYVHSVDKVILYDKNAVNSQQERMRFSQNMLLPELANNGIYGAYPSEISAKNNYGDGNRVAFTQDYFDNLHCNSENMILRYCVLGAWRAFESTQLQGWGNYDFSIRLPHVPTGKYELRICYPPMYRGGEIEYYIGNDSSAIETMTKLSTLDATENPCEEGNSMGCEQIDEPDFGVSSDKTMRQNGFMRAPASFSRGTYNTITQKLAYDPNDIYSAAKNVVGSTSCRSEWGYGTMMLRYIVGTVDMKQGQDYWLRIKGAVKDGYYDNDLGWSFNFIELVPVDVVNNKTYMEDWY